MSLFEIMIRLTILILGTKKYLENILKRLKKAINYDSSIFGYNLRQILNEGYIYYSHNKNYLFWK